MTTWYIGLISTSTENRKETGMQRHSRQFWEEQLREYWDSGFTVSEYSELIGQSKWTVQDWIRKLKAEHESSEIIEPEQAEPDKPCRLPCPNDRDCSEANRGRHSSFPGQRSPAPHRRHGDQPEERIRPRSSSQRPGNAEVTPC